MTQEAQRPAAVIFDMDGVLVDSNPFHLQKWAEFLRERGVAFQEADLPQLILGQRNDTLFRYFFGSKITAEESRRMGEEVEARFRAAFKAHAKPLAGLDALIREIHAAGIPMAVASSAICKNVEFVVDSLGYRQYFKLLVSGEEVTRPKPDPEIYLLAAARLGVRPEDAVAFEDSFPGVEAVKAAGIKCVGIASSFPLEELRARAGRAVGSFAEIHLRDLRRLFLN